MRLLDTIQADPYQNPPPYETLRGDMAGSLSRRINRQHRLVYDVYDLVLTQRGMPGKTATSTSP
jgi:Txe/YoeB family toxin of toxin-antitoxin system